MAVAVAVVKKRRGGRRGDDNGDNGENNVKWIVLKAKSKANLQSKLNYSEIYKLSCVKLKAAVF